MHWRGVLFALRLFGVASGHLRVGEVACFLRSCFRLLCILAVCFVACCSLIYLCLSIKKKKKNSGFSKHMIEDKSFFTTFEDFNGGNVTLGDGSVARVRGKASVTILEFPKLNDALY